MNKFLSGVMSTIQNHPYATAAGTIVAAELLRSRDCRQSFVSNVATLAAVGATINAAFSAAQSGVRAVRNPYMLSNPRYAASGTGLLTGLPVVRRSAYEGGISATQLASERGGKPTTVGILSPKGVGKGERVVRGRHDYLHLIKRQCGSRTGKPGAALSTGGYAGCDRRDAGRVMGLKSWRDSAAFTEARELSSLRNLAFAYRKRGDSPPPSITRRIAQLKARVVEPSLTQAATRGRIASGR